MTSGAAPVSRPLRLGLVLFPGCMPAGLFVTADLVRACNLRLGNDIVRTSWIGVDLQPVPTRHGPSLQPEQVIAGAGCDALLVPGLWATSAEQLQVQLVAQGPLVQALRALPSRTQLWSYCAGVPL